MSDPAESSVQNLLPVQAYFDAQDNFQTFIGQNKPFYATTNPEQSGLHITDSTIDSTTIGATTPSTGVFTNVSTTTGQVSTAPVTNTDIANKQYVDAVAQGLKPKQAVKCATTGDITLSGLQTIDTYTTLAGDRVLVKNQTNTAENGIYIAASGTWTRSSDMDVWSEVPGSYTVALNGSTNLDTGWACTAAETGTIGVTAMPWVQFSGSATYYAGTGLTLAANTFSITNTGVTAATKGSASKTVTATVNAQGQLTSLTDQDIAIAATQVTSGTLDSARLSGSYTGITGVGTLTAGTWNASTIDVAHGGTGATTLTGYVKGSGTSALTASSTIPNTDITGLGTMSTQDASNVAITGGSAALGTLKTLGLTGYLYGNDTTAVTASTTIPNTAITGLGSMSTQNANNVAITGGYATGLTNLGADYLQLNTGATVTPAIGRVWWDGGTTMNMGMTANVTSHVSEDTFFYVKASGAITKGQLCAFTGVVGASGVITAAPAGAGITNADYIVGVAAESIASGSFGLIQWFGTLRGFDTSAWVDGDVLYYDPAAGGFTTTYPTSGIIVTVAAVINAGSGGSGSILIRPTKTQRITGGSGISVTQTTAGSSVAISSPVSIANGGTNGTATPTAGAVAYGTGSAYAFTSAGVTGQFLQSNGSGAPTWATPVSYATVTDDTTTNATRYPLFADQTSGNLATEYTSSTKFQYNPSTGTLSASVFSGAGTSLTGTASSLSIGGNAATATSATTATNLAGGANGSVPYQTGSGATTMLAAGSNGQILTLAGGVPTWAAAPATGITVTDDTTTNATRYLTFTSATTGSITGENVASTKLQFNPSTGVLNSSAFVASAGLYSTGTYTATYTDGIVADYATGNGRISVGSTDTLTFYNGGVANTQLAQLDTKGNLQISGGIYVNSKTISANYSIPSGSSGMSAGPITISSGVSVTVASGSKWVVL